MRSFCCRVKREKLVVFPTDKSGKTAIMREESYIEMAKVHVDKDVEVNWDVVEKVEKEANRHSMAFCKIFKLGVNLDQADRIVEVIRSVDNAPPPTYFLVKDHKPKNSKGLYPTRPVCGANEGPLRRVQMLVNMVLLGINQSWSVDDQCMSTEELKRAIDDCNKLGLNGRIAIFSMDVKALYPSLMVDLVVRLVEEEVRRLDIVIDGVDWREVGKYLVVVCNEDELDGLGDVLPYRVKGKRKVELSYLDKDVDANNEEKWEWSRDVSVGGAVSGDVKKKLLALVLKKMVGFIMENHVYRFNRKFYRQSEGGPIGLLITTTLAEMVMKRWDRDYRVMMASARIHIPLYKRYVDDCSIGYVVGSGGTTGDLRYDARSMRVAANRLMGCIQMESRNSMTQTTEKKQQYS